MKICSICKSNYDSMDSNRSVCFNCSKIDYEEMWRQAIYEVGRLKDQNKQLKEALTNLVKLKEYKDMHGKDIYYQEYQPKYWNVATKLTKESEVNRCANNGMPNK